MARRVEAIPISHRAVVQCPKWTKVYIFLAIQSSNQHPSNLVNKKIKNKKKKIVKKIAIQTRSDGTTKTWWLTIVLQLLERRLGTHGS